MVFRLFLDGHEPRAQGCAKEAIVADFHKGPGEHMLEEALHEFLRREGRLFELPGIGGAVLEGDLRGFQAAGVQQADQTPVAESYTVNIRSQITECRLSVAHRLAVD